MANIDLQNLESFKHKLEALKKYQTYNKLEFIFPDTGPSRRELYGKHLDFFRAGANHRFRMLSGGNGTGKSFTMGYEIALHCTGAYPNWWNGKRLPKIQSAWVVCETGSLWRDSLQKLLFGNPGEDIGTGLIPDAKKSQDGYGIIETTSMPGIPGAVGRALIKHKNGQIVSLVVKTYDMDRKNLQAATVDLVAFDEEPPEDVYTECVMRTRGTKTKEPGIAMLAFTPLKGLSDVVLKYLPGGVFPQDGTIPGEPDKFVVRVTWDDAPHLSEVDKQALINEIPAHLRDSRTKGIPALGSGKVYPISEDEITFKSLHVSSDWKRAFGMDFGWNCTAAVWGTQDPVTGVIYLYGEHYLGEKAPYVHANAIKARGAWIPGICDPRGDKSSERDGSKLIDEYSSLGLNLQAGDNAIQAGVSRVLNMLESGLLKVSVNLEHWLSEFRIYRYDSKNPNQIARNQKDHLMDATRYLLSIFDYVAVSYLEAHPDEDDTKPMQYTGRNEITGY